MASRPKTIITHEGLEKKIKIVERSVLRHLRLEKATVDIFLVSRGEMVKMRDRFFKKDKGSSKHLDVLSFNEPNKFPRPDKKGRFLGEVYVNEAIGLRDPERLMHLVIHGILHLAGYHHERRSDIIQMENKEQLLWHHISSLV
jgi:ssRNA-specific RNase YbeY (16S rRNA maturation enzyme)